MMEIKVLLKTTLGSFCKFSKSPKFRKTNFNHCYRVLEINTFIGVGGCCLHNHAKNSERSVLKSYLLLDNKLFPSKLHYLLTIG